MKLNPKLELIVLQAIRNIGEGTNEEILTEVTKTEEIKEQELTRIIRRWKAKKVITDVYVNENGSKEKAWKIADIPSFPLSDMSRIKTLQSEEAQEFLDDLENKVLKGAKSKQKVVIGEYPWIEIVFETLDPILGARPDEKGVFRFPTLNGKPAIPPAWWKGYLRSNGRLKDIPETHAKFYTAYSWGIVENGATLKPLSANTERGPAIYESLPKGTQIRMLIRFPMRGSSITSPKEFERFLNDCAIAPIRGFGANPYVYGGRIKPVEFKVVGESINLKNYEKLFGA